MIDIVMMRTPDADEPVHIIIELRNENNRMRTALERLANPEFGEYPSDEMTLQAVVKISRAALTKDQQ
jgi:hypothetical protein